MTSVTPMRCCAGVYNESDMPSPLDSIRMFSSYFDVIIMRARYPHFAEACAHLMNDLDRMIFGCAGVS